MKQITLKFLGNNVDGILNKLESLENIIKTENPGAIFLQETKVGRPGRIKIPSNKTFSWYKMLRTDTAEKGERGGGIAIGVLNQLEPSWINEGDNDAEAITIEIWVGGFPIRLICGYGPQEGDKVERKEKFWKYLTSEVQKAKDNGAKVIIQMDGNLWAGSDIIKGDPRPQNRNGKLFQEFLQSNPNLNVTNAISKCEGKITRVRHMKNKTQESILDFFIVCDEILPLVTKMKIHEKDDLAIKRYKEKAVKSDHKMLSLELDLKIHNDTVHDKVEVFNIRNKTCQTSFFEFISKEGRFTKCFSSCEDEINVQFKRWKRKIDKAINACFRKIRVKEKVKLSTIDRLMEDKKLILKGKDMSEEKEERIDRIEALITNEIAELEFEKLRTVIGDIDNEPNLNMWREMRKAYPKVNKPLPTGVKDINGKVVTNPIEKKKVTLKHFQHRMRTRKIHEKVEEVDKLNKLLFEERLKEAKLNVSPPFSVNELDKVLKELKTGKCKDPDNYIFELFKDGVIGNDLRKSILIMMNIMKNKMKIPECLRKASITILHKNKDKLDLTNWRGIFVTSVLRAILMKLIYNRTYHIIDQNMSDAQIGARKKKSVRNHLFVLNAILSDVMTSKSKVPVDINVMDFKQMFDAEELSNVLNAMYESGIKDDMLVMLNEANENVQFAVKTPNGLTEYRSISNKIMQGDVMAPLMSSNFVDVNIVKTAVRTKNIYMYKDKVPIPPLIMQDDTLTISACGMKTLSMNTMINTSANIMGLQFGSDKCVKIHMGKNLNSDICGKGRVDAWNEEIVVTETGEEILVDKYKEKTEMKTVDDKKYLGQIISKDLKNEKNIKDKTNKAVGNVNKIITTLNERPFGKFTFKAASLMRDGVLISSLLNNAET